MATEKRTIFLACVTLTVYALSGLLQQGKFLYPFPLNEFIFFGISAYIAIRNFKQQKPLYTLLILAAISFVASRSYNWNLILSSESMERLDHGYTTDVFYVLFYGILSTLTYKLAKNNSHQIHLPTYLSSILLILLGSIFALDSICILGIVVQVKTFYHKENTTTTPFVYLYSFLAFLLATKELTLFLA